jgi:hypothetical protein
MAAPNLYPPLPSLLLLLLLLPLPLPLPLPPGSNTPQP